MGVLAAVRRHPQGCGRGSAYVGTSRIAPPRRSLSQTALSDRLGSQQG